MASRLIDRSPISSIRVGSAALRRALGIDGEQRVAVALGDLAAGAGSVAINRA